MADHRKAARHRSVHQRHSIDSHWRKDRRPVGGRGGARACARNSAVTPAPRASWPRLLDWSTTYLFILPALVLFAVFSLFPFVKVFQLSVYEWDGVSPTMQFVGLQNFATALFRDPSWR